jgi:hypothetical protein
MTQKMFNNTLFFNGCTVTVKGKAGLQEVRGVLFKEKEIRIGDKWYPCEMCTIHTKTNEEILDLFENIKSDVRPKKQKTTRSW